MQFVAARERRVLSENNIAPQTASRQTCISGDRKTTAPPTPRPPGVRASSSSLRNRMVKGCGDAARGGVDTGSPFKFNHDQHLHAEAASGNAAQVRHATGLVPDK